MQSLKETNLQFDCHFTKRKGKVRDVYTIEGKYTLLVATDRLSAFDHQIRQQIPYKGQVLNQLAVYFLEATEDICPNHLVAIPHPMAIIGFKAEPYPVEVIVRGNLCGSAWRKYSQGERLICGVSLPEGLRENDFLPEPIVTPTTKSAVGPDVDITEDEIVKSGLVPAEEWMRIRSYALALFRKGQQMARERGLILADTKYEFGNHQLDVILIDEVHTPDSSRYFYADGFEEKLERGEPQKQLSKEFARQWLIKAGFMGLPGQVLPDLPEEVIEEISKRYIEVYEMMTGKVFEPVSYFDLEQKIQEGSVIALQRMGLL